jgi:hypothetical protein
MEGASFVYVGSTKGAIGLHFAILADTGNGTSATDWFTSSVVSCLQGLLFETGCNKMKKQHKVVQKQYKVVRKQQQ